jgi:uncharacterized membrane protein
MEQPTQQERTLAGGVHIASIFFPWLAPIVGIVVAGKSKFIRYHAVLALTEQVILTLTIGLIMIASLSHSIYNLYQQYQEGFKDFNIWPILIKSVAIWVGFAIFGLWNSILSIFQGIRAFKGNWGGKGLSSRISRKLLKVPKDQQPASIEG